VSEPLCPVCAQPMETKEAGFKGYAFVTSCMRPHPGAHFVFYWGATAEECRAAAYAVESRMVQEAE